MTLLRVPVTDSTLRLGNVTCTLTVDKSPGKYVQPGIWNAAEKVVKCVILSTTESPLLPATLNLTTETNVPVGPGVPVWFGSPTRVTKNCSYSLIQRLSGPDDMSDFSVITPKSDTTPFCTSTANARNAYADKTAWPAIQRYYSASDNTLSAKTSKRFMDCYKLCGQSRSVTKYRKKRCKYFALNFPIPFKTAKDAGNLYSGSVVPTRSAFTWSLNQACGFNTTGARVPDCLNRQAGYKLLSTHFLQTVTNPLNGCTPWACPETSTSGWIETLRPSERERPLRRL
ncbi:uncharacterized protein EV422DRAFT_160517 [Fimicolochytrium jonesii]|uniref:uncharacterized protein n=1 Tax=Fimicolochytrium jonesii TaxID=1396493 RepID=UPI0022FF0B23|nr:uncharacterized protein EV422DRAFT_160517 [Fimicolochytrium jonesii]KAI8826267.1 hypothetical protein EV422DRAFT_160517 [Fimicolochytrium jonesii]